MKQAFINKQQVIMAMLANAVAVCFLVLSYNMGDSPDHQAVLWLAGVVWLAIGAYRFVAREVSK